MDKRYQIFVSSTFSDLIEERQAVTQALLSLDHFPAGMELFPASDDDAREMIKSVIDDSDYYILVIAGRYGSISSEGLSYTEGEYNHAYSISLPVLAFIHSDPGRIAAAQTEMDPTLRAKLQSFRDTVQSRHHVKFWNTPGDLKAKVIQAVSAETKRNPREGWIRSSQAADPTQLNQLLKQNKELKEQIENISSNPPEGSRNLESGKDEFSVTVNYQESFLDTKNTTIVKLDWDAIFYEIGPLMLQECSEQRMKRYLDSQIHLYDEKLCSVELHSCSIDSDSFETIKIQLYALGLIKRSDRKHTVSDHSIYWSITPYGERILMMLRARRRKSESLAEVELRM